jgi:tRNA(Ser,Leu) C12 N-acetylase TAN1
MDANSNMLEHRPHPAKLIVTGRGPYSARQCKSLLKEAFPDARVRSAGFRFIFALEAEGDALELAGKVHRQCSESVGHVTAVLAEVESRIDPIREAAVKIGAEQIGESEKFCFRLHKRGSHWLEKDTSELEDETGQAIWTALKQKYGKDPAVDLDDPEITVTAEVLGPNTAVGISRKAWKEGAATQNSQAVAQTPGR